MTHRYLFSFVVVVSFLSSFACFRANAEIRGLPFEVEQEQDYWCWGALTQAFGALRGVHLPQCEIINQELGRRGGQSCCLKRNEKKRACNPRFINNKPRLNQVLGFSALSRNNLLYLNKKPSSARISRCSKRERRFAADCRKLTRLGDLSQARLSAQEMRAHVEAGRPVGLFYQFGVYATGHFVWVAGIHDYLGPNGSPRYLVNEPMNGGGIMFYHFTNNRRVMTYEQLAAGELLEQPMGFPINVHAQWIATGVGKSQSDP